MEIRTYGKLTYVLKFPVNYDVNKHYPVIFYIHGAGTRGTDIELIKTDPYFKYTEEYSEFPFITVAPQCFEDTWFDLFETLKEFIKYICGENFADEKRIYMMGVSMGAYTAWQLTMSMPEIFAAVVPICGGGMYWNAERLKNVPVWAFHGAKDNIVYPEESEKMVERINSFGGNAKLTIYPECDHNSWESTYGNYEVFKWLLEQTK